MSAVSNAEDDKLIRLNVVRRYRVPGPGIGVAVDPPAGMDVRDKSLVGQAVILQWNGRGALFRVKAADAIAADDNIGLWVEEIVAA